MDHNNNVFVPKLAQVPDRLSQKLITLARSSILLMAVLLPFFFIPGSPGLLHVSKIFFPLFMVLFAVTIASLAILRKGSIVLVKSPVLLAWWGVVLAAFISAILSPDVASSLIGDALQIQTVGFLALLGLIMTASLLFIDAKQSLVYLFGGILIGMVVLSLFHVVRILIGSDGLGLGVLQNGTSSLVGSWNDLGILLGATIIMLLVTMLQLPLPRKILLGVGLAAVPILMVLTVINFFALWIILGLVGLSVLVYSLVRDRFSDREAVSSSLSVSLVSGLVFLVSVVNLLGGSSLSGFIANQTGLQYVEVRPSTEATLSIMQQVYQSDAFTGIGPNRFVDAWRLYKDQAVNESIFWNTDFTAGNGFVPTWFVTTGILGALTWFIFLATLLYTGFMMLMRTTTTEKFWYYIATVSYLLAVVLWGIAIIYVPGPVILIMAALATGTMIVAEQALLQRENIVINFFKNPRSGFVLIAGVMVMIIGTVSLGYGAARQFTALTIYANAANDLGEEDQIMTLSSRLVSAYNIFPSDIFLRDLAGYQLAQLSYLISLPEPTAEDQQDFQTAISAAIEAGNEAVSRNSTDARNWLTVGDIYATLAAVNIEGSAERAIEAYNAARERDPKNPYYDIQLAVLAFRAEDYELARTHANAALALKSNYTDAVYLLSQLDIIAGDLEKAISTTEALVSLDANNPGRYYQLGLLYRSNKENDKAMLALSKAVEINPNYANARYVRALLYAEAGEVETAISELKLVQEKNQDNALIAEVIAKLEAGDVAGVLNNNPTQIDEPESVEVVNEVTTTSDDPETDLITPVNTVPDTSSEDTPAAEDNTDTE